jgi:hypothetical protein
MNFYHYLFSCAYWVFLEDLKEKSAPQEYAFIFISVIDLLLFVALSGLVNLYLTKNILSGFSVIIVSATIAFINYLVFLRAKRFREITGRFVELNAQQSKRKRIGTMVVTFSTAAFVAIMVSFLNSLK